MVCTINKIKHLHWYMVLATVVVLMWVLNSPKTMVKMIVAGSSASQHSSRDARVKRQLRPSSYMTEDINGGDEERVAVDFNLPAQSGNIIGALKIGEELEANMPKVDENAKSLFEKVGLVEWADSLNVVSWDKYEKAAIAKLSELIDANGEDWVISMIAAAENVPAVKVFAQKLECALVVKWVNEKRDEDVAKMLVAGKGDMIEFLANPALTTWINFYYLTTKKLPYQLLFDELLTHYNEAAVATQLVVAQGNVDTHIIAEFLVKCQMRFWYHHGYSGDDVFERMELKAAGSGMFESPLWDTWISYMRMLSGKKATRVSELLLPVLRKHFDDDDALFKWLADAKKAVKTKHRVASLETALRKLTKPVEKEGEAPATTKRQRDDGEATAPTNRQRNGDGH